VGFRIDGCRITSKAIVSELGRAQDVPCAWLEVDGRLVLVDGVAVFLSDDAFTDAVARGLIVCQTPPLGVRIEQP
jgi:hypothetical protein